MVVCRGANIARMREGSQRVFVTAALGFAEAVTADEILRAAFAAITGDADAVLTSRGDETVRALAHEQIPVVGDLGFVPLGLRGDKPADRVRREPSKLG